MTSDLPRLLLLQQSRNAQTRDAWQHFAGHRQQVMELLRPESESPEARLCVLGAGNCNDVDLAVLSAQYARIDLIDWDEAAIKAGVWRQLKHSANQVAIHSGLDLTSIAGDLSQCSAAQPPSDRQISELCSRATAASVPNGIAPVNTAASLCLLSQLMEMCAAALGPDHPRLPDLAQAVRAGHLRQLAGCLRPGGKGVVVTDLVSSDTAAELQRIGPPDLPRLLYRLLSEGNLFLGLHPQALLGAFQTDPVLKRAAIGCRVTPPWLWSMGPRRYAVFGLVFRSAP